MSDSQTLRVTTHVGRDLLDAAAAFKTEASVVWEYVVNSLQYTDPGVSPRAQVDVSPRNRRIVISDNGRGMTADDLQHFFTMHAENRDRLQGRAGRGKFGTGKSAAFGIGNALRVESTCEGLRNVALLTREMIEASEGQDIPVQWEERNKPTEDPNGTVVLIDQIVLPRLKTAPIVDYIERHLQTFRSVSPQVAVNSHVCSYREPEVEAERRFSPSPSQAGVLGDAELIVKVARAPLPEIEQGIAVTSGVGNLVAVEKGGIEHKEFGSYLFGEIDVPAIENSDSPIAPYDSSRSLQLNPQHPVVAVLLGFVGSKLEAVRSELVANAREARKTEQARRLAAEADKIAQILNEDFRKVRQRLHEIRAASARPGSAAAAFGKADSGADEPDAWVRGTQLPGSIEKTSKAQSRGDSTGRKAPDITPRGELDESGSDPVDPAGGSGKKRSRPSGGFRVEYLNLGKTADRSQYDSSTLTIIINLDHPVAAAALGDGKVEDPAFKRLSYEIAFSEYAMGLGYEVAEQDPNIPADDLLYEVRSSLNRVAASAASLYR